MDRWLFLLPALACLAWLGGGKKLVKHDPKTMTRTLRDGSLMPMVGLGTWKSEPKGVENAVVHAVCNGGYRHIDAAQIYLNQEEVGRGLRRAEEECGIARELVWVTSKVWMTDFAPEDVPGAVDRILVELDLDYVDQLLLHWPFPYARPPEGCPPSCPERWAGTDFAMRPRDADGNMVHGDTPLADTWRALEAAKKAGKVRSIGVSNFNAEEIKSLSGGRPDATVPAVNQVEAHVFWNQASLLADMKALGVNVVAYTPLGNPGMFGNQSGIASALVTDIAAETGLTAAQVMLSFLLQRGWIVVPKSVTPARIDENINVKLRLTDAHIARLLREAPQKRLVNPNNRPGGKPVFVDDLSAAGRGDGEL